MSKLSKKKLKKIIGKILNSPFTYLVLILLILIQFTLVSIIFFEFKQNKSAFNSLQQTINKISSQQNLINEKLNTLQSNIMVLQSYFYRLQRSNESPE